VSINNYFVCVKEFSRPDISRNHFSLLYSALHLEPEYASMLAEWLDVGQFNNP
jgi:hypothetical protein